MKHLFLFLAIWLAALSFTANATNISVTPSTLVAAASTAASGDTLVLAAGTYTTAIQFPAIALNLKADPAAATQPEIAFQLKDTSAVGGSLTFVGLSINPNADYFFTSAKTNNMNAWKFVNCNILNVKKSLIYTTANGGTITSILIDNCVFAKTTGNTFGSSTISFISLCHILGSLTVQNSTINNFTGGNFYNAKQSAVGNTITVLFKNNTFYKSIINNNYALCSIEGGGYDGLTSTYTFTNNIVDGTAAASGVTPRIMYTKIGGQIVESSNLNTSPVWGNLAQGGTGLLQTYTNLTIGTGTLASVTAIPYANAANGDFSIPSTSALATAGVNGACLGAPRWIKAVTVPVTASTSISPAGAGTATPTSLSVNKGDKVQFTAAQNFGYRFVNWTTSDGTVVSTDASFSYTATADINLTANFATFPTYSLGLTIAGGAKDYMVTVSPAGATVNGNLMYEKGTVVTLTASNNSILTFTNWSTGETSSTLSFTMDQNRSVSANYSAVDYIVGWDFYNSGGSNRVADFYSTSDNAASTLVLRQASGTTNSWLDKSTLAAGGYYGAGAAVNWKATTDQYYYQISLNAKDFTGIKVSAGMLYNYDAWSVQKCEYSLDGTTFTTLGTYTFAAVQTWYSNTFSLPASADHAATVYIRWIPDYTSTFLGTPGNDGTSISNIFITGTAAVVNDGVPPVLSSSVPAASATNASTTGSVVLTFDEKVQLTSSVVVGTLNGKQLTPNVAGKTITLPYSGLTYGTQYTFVLPANSVSDLGGNTLASPVSITFTTMTRPVVTKKLFDFVVGVDGDLKAGILAATTASSTGLRFRIFFPNGQYDIGSNTGNSNQLTTIALPNVSFIGQNADSVILYNKPTTEGIGVTATILLTSAANNIYMQDVTLLNKFDYRSGSFNGRAAALQEQGDKNIFKNVNLLSNQDTYYSNTAGRIYFEGGSLHGTVDFICGGGDVFFNQSLLYIEDRSGSVISAAATSATNNWGFVFSNCTIDGYSDQNGAFYLGRPWTNAPRTVFINSKMNIIPTPTGWTEMGGVGTLPIVYGEYNSTTSSGSAIDVSLRKTTFTTNNVSVNTILTAQQAAAYTVENVLSGSDSWNPRLYTDQASAPVVSKNGNVLTWNDNNYVLCWAVFKDRKFVTFVNSNSYTIPSSVTSGTYEVRAANEMGGLSAYSNKITVSQVVKSSSSIAWDNPQSITYGTPLSATQLNAIVTGTTGASIYTPSLGTILSVGTHTLTVVFEADDNFLSATKTVEIVVNKAPSTVTWNDPSLIGYGTALGNTQLNATVTGTTGVAVYTPAAGTKLSIGRHTLSVTFAADDNYEGASKSVTIVVTNATSVINIQDESVAVLPNPTSGNVTVQLPSSLREGELAITSMNGRVVGSKHLSENITSVDITSLPSGTYVFQISIAGNMINKLIIKK